MLSSSCVSPPNQTKPQSPSSCSIPLSLRRNWSYAGWQGCFSLTETRGPWSYSLVGATTSTVPLGARTDGCLDTKLNITQQIDEN